MLTKMLRLVKLHFFYTAAPISTMTWLTLGATFSHNGPKNSCKFHITSLESKTLMPPVPKNLPWKKNHGTKGSKNKQQLEKCVQHSLSWKTKEQIHSLLLQVVGPRVSWHSINLQVPYLARLDSPEIYVLSHVGIRLFRLGFMARVTNPMPEKFIEIQGTKNLS